jgi:hypothetical protein
MKSAVRSIVQRVLLHDSINRAFERTLGKTADYLRLQRQVSETTEINRFLRENIPNNLVLSGPFAGLAYPSLTALGSALYPKLLGTYENELHDALDLILREEFDQIIDVGCAEGYYAVGLARRFPRTPVLAFDLDPAARRACRSMADFNGAGTHLEIHSFCNPDHLARICRGKRNLIVSDCEGFEAHLFPAANVTAFADSYLVIEVHDFFGEPVGDPIASSLASTHATRLISAVTTGQKLAMLGDSPVRTLPAWEQAKLISEERPAGMYWIVATPKSAATPATEDVSGS